MRKLLHLCLIVSASFLPAAGVAADLLDEIVKRGTVRLGVRPDAPPFSYRNEVGEPAGYTVDLCRAVVVQLGRRAGKQLTISYQNVTAENRFARLKNRSIDLLCGATTETIRRRRLAEFSVATFITGASVIYRDDGPKQFEDLVQSRVGVVHGTTTEADLQALLRRLGVKATVVPVADHRDGLRKLTNGTVAAYFADHAILSVLIGKSRDGLIKFRLSDRIFSSEPYALAMPKGETRLRDEVDLSLSRVYRAKEMEKIFGNSFGDDPPTDLMKALLLINAIPE